MEFQSTGICSCDWNTTFQKMVVLLPCFVWSVVLKFGGLFRGIMLLKLALGCAAARQVYGEKGAM